MNMTSLTQTIASLLEAHPERPVLIALDGRCGSGKTTLAAQLAEQFPGSAVFHTDDYYLPPAQRIPNWAETPCANMDLTRLREEVLVPAIRDCIRDVDVEQGQMCVHLLPGLLDINRK